MASPSFRRSLARKPSGRVLTEPPGPWPMDPALSRRVVETRRHLEHRRRELARHALPMRKPHV